MLLKDHHKLSAYMLLNDGGMKVSPPSLLLTVRPASPRNMSCTYWSKLATTRQTLHLLQQNLRVPLRLHYVFLGTTAMSKLITVSSQ